MDIGKKPTNIVNSLVKGLHVIKSFSGCSEGLTISEVARRCGLDAAGARRILLTLESLGYASQERRRFRLTPRVLEVGYSYLSSMPSWSFGQSLLEHLAGRTNETCSASVLDGTEIVYVLRAQIRRILFSGGSVGTRIPAYVTSMGRIWLANRSEEQLDEYFAKAQLQAFTKATITDERKLRAEIQRIKKQGWAYVDGELEEGVSGISVPVYNPSGHIVLAINISASSRRISRHVMKTDLLEELIKTKAEFQDQLAIGHQVR